MPCWIPQKLVVDYHEAYIWADTDRHRLIGMEWQATKRAIAAERELERLRKELQKLVDIDDTTV